MKRFIVFAGEYSCSKGGFKDYIDSFNKIEEFELYNLVPGHINNIAYEWVHVYDAKKKTIVYQYENGEESLIANKKFPLIWVD